MGLRLISLVFEIKIPEKAIFLEMGSYFIENSHTHRENVGNKLWICNKNIFIINYILILNEGIYVNHIKFYKRKKLYNLLYILLIYPFIYPFNNICIFHIYCKVLRRKLFKYLESLINAF